ncbi:hypothetical protein D3C79_844920 [compost metagenome]
MTCAGITAANCPLRRVNGTRSAWRSCSRLRSSVGMATCESASAQPCPGKCLPQAAMPAAFMPRMNAPASCVARSGSPSKARLPTTALRWWSRSSTGAKLRSRPTASTSVAINQPHCSARYSALSLSASARMAGRRTKPWRRRCTRPPSWSTARIRSGRMARIDAHSSRTWRGLSMLRAKMIRPATSGWRSR